jgi:hypothetical protein
MIKLIDTEFLRVWLVPNNDWMLRRKIFKRLGFILFVPGLRVSCTLVR